jgi:predicted nucleic acid-binding protein
LNTLVDTSVWSLALRRDRPPELPELRALERALGAGSVVSTGLVLQELLQGFSKPKAQGEIIERFRTLPFIVPDRDDHIAAAELRIKCRRRGVQTGTIDVLLAQLCIRHELTMLTTDNDFRSIGRIAPFALWLPE